MIPSKTRQFLVILQVQFDKDDKIHMVFQKLARDKTRFLIKYRSIDSQLPIFAFVF